MITIQPVIMLNDRISIEHHGITAWMVIGPEAHLNLVFGDHPTGEGRSMENCQCALAHFSNKVFSNSCSVGSAENTEICKEINLSPRPKQL